MCMLDEMRAKRDEIYAIARRHKVEKLWVFGSCTRKEERPDSVAVLGSGFYRYGDWGCRTVADGRHGNGRRMPVDLSHQRRHGGDYGII